MILLLRRRTITILVLVAVIFALGMSVFGYLSLQSAGDLSSAERKVVAERVLLAGIIGTLVVLLTLVLAAWDAISLNSVFRRLSGMHRMSGDQLHSVLRSLGAAGDEISTLYDNINSLSSRKSTRIAAMNSLLSTVLARSGRKMLIVNAAGTVYRATAEALEQLELSSADVTDKPIDTIVEAETFSETAAAIARSVGPHAIERGKEAVAVIPVMNNQGLAAYYVYLLGSDAKEELKRNPQDRAPAHRVAVEHGGSGASAATAERQQEAGSTNVIRTLLDRVTRKRK